MKNIRYILLAILVAITSISVTAKASPVLQTEVPTIIVPHNPVVDYRERTLCYIIDANIPYTVSTDATWASVTKKDNGSVYVHLDQNFYADARTASVIFSNEEIGINQVMTITQTRDESVQEAPSDTYIAPSKAEDNTHQGSENAAQSIDRDFSTLYHSAYTGFNVSRSKPAILTYTFTNVDVINYVIYNPRSSGTNGNFGEVEVLLKHKGESNYTSYGEFDFKFSGDANMIVFDEEKARNITGIQFKVYSGSGNFASCAEMEFFAYSQEGIEEYAIFGDPLYTTLREGVTRDDIDALDNPFVKALAMQLFEGNYDTKYRVADYECYIPVQTLSDQWNAPGKYYDQRAGVTGINITKGKQAIVVSGIPDDCNVGLAVTAWWVGKEGNNFDGGDPKSFTYGLRNGLNVIDYTFEYDGLAYIRYYDDDADNRPDIHVHFVNGQQNGYLSNALTNKEMQALCQNAKNFCMDVVGERTHTVWTSEGLYKYCKDSKGTGLGYRQYINLLDSLIVWEHRSLGFEKYGRVPRNRTMAYVNFTYYMFQGGFGVSFHHNQEQRVLNCKTLIYNDNDAIWGLSHEWGHQHQMHPYFCWGGLGEVSNNVQSYYNITHMGYRTSDKIQSWPEARKHFYETLDKPVAQNANTKGFTPRRLAYENRASIRNATLKALAASQTKADTLATAYNDNPRKAVCIHEMNVGELLCPFIMLNNYFTNHRPDGKTDTKYCDFSADWYESLRQNDEPLGSQIEKQGFVDKYELLASVQNSNKNNKLAEFREKYPESCWVKKQYVDAQSNKNENSIPFIMNWIRKTSRLSGYNLWPYFERFGFLRTIALHIGDYGGYFYLMTDDMYNEFKEDMDALVESGELKAMDEQLIHDIFYCPDDWQPVPTIAND